MADASRGRPAPETCEATLIHGDFYEHWINRIIEAARPALRGPFTTRYVHHDFKPNNVLCEKTPKCWVARGVVDLMEGYFGDPEEDLVRCIGPSKPVKSERC